MSLSEQRAQHWEFLENAYENEEKLRRTFDVQEITFEEKFKTGFIETHRLENGKVGHIVQQTRAVVTLIFSQTEAATYFRKNIIEKNPHSFERVKQEGRKLEFDLTTNLVENIFDISGDPLDEFIKNPIHWGLIEKYGGRETLINHLWKIAESDILDTTAIVTP